MVGRGWPRSQKCGTAKADGVKVGYECLITRFYVVNRGLSMSYADPVWVMGVAQPQQETLRKDI